MIITIITRRTQTNKTYISLSYLPLINFVKVLDSPISSKICVIFELIDLNLLIK